MFQLAVVTGNHSPSVGRHKVPPGGERLRHALGSWRVLAATVGVLVAGSALTTTWVWLRGAHEKTVLARMNPDAAAGFAKGTTALRWSWGAAGAVLTLVGSFTVWKYLLAQERQSAARGRYLTGLEMLHRTILRVGSQMGHGGEILTEMAEAARRLLGMDSSLVLLLDAGQRVFRVQAEAGGFSKKVPATFTVEETPACFGAVQSGQPVIVSDVNATDSSINAALVRKVGSRAVAVIPLRLDGAPVGVMVLADANPRKFSDSDRRLVEMLAAQTEAILANSLLYEKARSAVAVYQNLLRQQEMLYNVAAAVYHATSFDESARAIVEGAPALLHIDGCSVQMCEKEGTTLRIVASTGEGAEKIIGLTFPVAGTCAEPVLESGRALVIEDARNADKPPKDIWRVRRVGSIVLLPLKRADQTSFGLLELVRYRTGPFTEEKLRLFEVFADRAQAALENALLQDQTRSDARTKTVLLRELHHRVNNNLAGIVGLLSMNQPEMSDAARRWIQRCIERIEVMARAHDLFRQGADRVRLTDLIARVPESIAVFQTAQTRIITDIEGEEVALATPRSVALAMVLHELCSNALQHGVKDGGQVRIRGVRKDGELAIQVCDDGAGFEPGEDAGGVSVSRGSGLGLQLVRELVGRELRGDVHIESSPGRGTTVSLAFPLDHDEEYHQ